MTKSDFGKKRLCLRLGEKREIKRGGRREAIKAQYDKPKFKILAKRAREIREADFACIYIWIFV